MPPEELRDEAEPEAPLQLAQDAREPEGRRSGVPSGSSRAAAGDADVGLALHEVDGVAEGPRPDDRVGVQQAGRIWREARRRRAGRIATLFPAANPPLRSGDDQLGPRPPAMLPMIAAARTSAESSPEAFSPRPRPGERATSLGFERAQAVTVSPAGR